MTDQTTLILSVVAIILGILIFIYPSLAAYIIGIALIIFGAYEIVKEIR